MNKTEKLLITPVFWVYGGVFIGLIFGALFGGRGGSYFVGTGFFAGCAVGLLRTLYLAFNYDDIPTTQSKNTARVIVRRIFYGLLYAWLAFVLINEFIKPLLWSNPYTYEWGEATEMYFSRDGQVIVPRTIIDMEYGKGHYYGLRMSVDHYSCDGGSASRFSNRRWYFILPVAEDAAIEFSDSEEFEAELNKRLPSGFDKLDYSLFQEKWDYYSSFYAKNPRADCIVEEGE